MFRKQLTRFWEPLCKAVCLVLGAGCDLLGSLMTVGELEERKRGKKKVREEISRGIYM